VERLYRSRAERVIAGVAGGLAEAIDVDPSIVRVAWVILALLSGGLLFIVYVVMAIVVPQEPFAGSYPGAGMPTPGAPAGAAGGPAAPRGVAAPGGMAAPGAAEATEPGTTPGAQPDMPEAQWREARMLERQRLRAERRAQAGGFPLAAVLGIVLVLVGAAFLAPRFFPRLDFDLIWPLVLVGLGAALIIGSLRRGGDRDERGERGDPGSPGAST
jgi:phage shock protein C